MIELELVTAWGKIGNGKGWIFDMNIVLIIVDNEYLGSVAIFGGERSNPGTIAIGGETFALE